MAITSFQDFLKGLTDSTSSAYAINKQYADTLAGRLAQLRANRDINKGAQQTLIDTAPQTYNPLRNTAYTNDQTAQRSLKERMANMGFGVTGGTSQTLDTQRAMGLQNRLGEIGLQQQNTIDTANRKIADIGTQYTGDEEAATNEVNSARDNALLDQYWKQVALEQQQEDAKFERAWALYSNKKITSKQFRDMTGIDVKTAATRRSQPKDSPNPLKDPLITGVTE